MLIALYYKEVKLESSLKLNIILNSKGYKTRIKFFAIICN